MSKPVVALSGHKALVRSVAFSPDSKLLASASKDETIRIWNTATFQLEREIRNSTQPYVPGKTNFGLNCVVFSPDGLSIATGSDDTRVKTWEVSTGERQHLLAGHSDSVFSVAYSLDGKRIASGGANETVIVWDTLKRTQQLKIDAHTHFVTSVSFSANGNLLASGSEDRSLRLWTLITGASYKVLKSNREPVLYVAFSPTNSKLLVAGAGNCASIWDVTTSHEIHSQDMNSIVRCVAFSGDGSLFAGASDNSIIQVWNTETGAEVGQLDAETKGTVALSFAANGQLIASAGFDHQVKLFLGPLK